MQRLKIDQDIHSLSDFRTGITSFLKQIHATKRPLIITQHGKSAAVLLDAGVFEAMQEKLELLQDVQTAIDEIEDGKGVEHSKAKELILNKLVR